ncbi:MAG: hypothetical protein ACFCBV_14060 [Phycisphaerales bacterium]
MVNATTRWVLYILSLVVIGPIAGLAMQLTSATDGSAGTAVANTNPALGVIALVVGTLLAAGVGGVAAWRCGLRPGLSCAGVVLCWMAGMSAGTTTIIAVSGEAPWGTLVVEGVLVAACLVAIGVVIALAAQKHTPAPGEHLVAQSTEAITTEESLAFSARSGAAVAIAAAAGGAAAWLLAVTDLRGQVIAAAGLAAIAIAVVVKLVDLKAPALAALGAAAILAIASPALGLIRVPANEALTAVYAQTLPGLALITPLDWAAGALLGTPFGLAWAASIVKRTEH